MLEDVQRSDCSIEENEICAHFEVDFSLRDRPTSREIDVPYTTVQRLTGFSLHSEESGRPRKAFSRIDRLIVRVEKADPTLSLKVKATIVY